MQDKETAIPLIHTKLYRPPLPVDLVVQPRLTTLCAFIPLILSAIKNGPRPKLKKLVEHIKECCSCQEQHSFSN